MRKLQAREKLFLTVGAAFVLVMLVGWFLKSTVLAKFEVFDRQIRVRTRELAEVEQLIRRHEVLEAQLAALEVKLRRQGGAPFLSRWDAIVSQAQLKSHLDVVQPQDEVEVEGFIETTREVKFSRVRLRQILELLRRLSFGSTVVSIKRLSIERRYDDQELLDLALVLASYEPKR